MIFWFRLYVNCKQCATESYSDCPQGKIKLRIVQYLNSSNYVSFNPWDRGQIGIKLETKVSKFYVGKGYLCGTKLASNWKQSML